MLLGDAPPAPGLAGYALECRRTDNLVSRCEMLGLPLRRLRDDLHVVKLPEALTRNLEGHDRISVTLGPKGELAVDDTEVVAATLQATIAARLAEHAEAIVVIRADKSVAYASVREIVKTAHAAGAEHIAVGTTQRGNAPTGAGL